MVMYNIKTKEIKFEPRIELNHNAVDSVIHPLDNWAVKLTKAALYANNYSYMNKNSC